MQISKSDIFRTNIVEDLKLFKKFDDTFFDNIRQISIDDLIYLKLFLTYGNLNKKFLKVLPISEIVDKIVRDVIERFLIHFKEKE